MIGAVSCSPSTDVANLQSFRCVCVGGLLSVDDRREGCMSVNEGFSVSQRPYSLRCGFSTGFVVHEQCIITNI